MNKTLQSIFVSSLSLFILFGFSSVVFAVDTNYVPLTTIPGVFTKGTATNPLNVIKGIYGLAIGVGSAIAVVMIIIAGLKYVYVESISGKQGAREQIQNAFIGLLIILASYIFLRTINPNLVNLNLTLMGGTGRLSQLIAANQRMDDAHKYAVMATENIKKLDAQIADLEKQRTDIESKLNNKYDDLSELDLTEEEKAKLQKEIGELESNLEKIKDERSLAIISKADYQLTALQKSTVSSTDQSFTTTRYDSTATLNLQGSQANALATFDETLKKLNSLDTNDATVKKAITETQARRDALQAEFAEQKNVAIMYTDTKINISTESEGASQAGQNLYSKSQVIATFAKQVEMDIATNVAKLKNAGLEAEAQEFETRAKDRLFQVCEKLPAVCKQ